MKKKILVHQNKNNIPFFPSDIEKSIKIYIEL